MRTFILQVDSEGKLIWSPNQKAIWHDWLLDKKEKQIRIKVEQYKGSKSKAQLGYWHGALVPEFAHYHSLSMEEAHAIMKEEFNYRFITTKDKAYRVGLSLSGANHETMSKAIENAVRYFEENGLTVPDPNEYKNKLNKAEMI